MTLLYVAIVVAVFWLGYAAGYWERGYGDRKRREAGECDHDWYQWVGEHPLGWRIRDRENDLMYMRKCKKCSQVQWSAHGRHWENVPPVEPATCASCKATLRKGAACCHGCGVRVCEKPVLENKS